MKDWKLLKKTLLKDPRVIKEYERLRPKYELISQLIAARRKKGLTQKELALKIGTKQTAIARLESGNANPTLDFLQRIASSLNFKLTIQVG